MDFLINRRQSISLSKFDPTQPKIKDSKKNKIPKPKKKSKKKNIDADESLKAFEDYLMSKKKEGLKRSTSHSFMTDRNTIDVSQFFINIIEQ